MTHKVVTDKAGGGAVNLDVSQYVEISSLLRNIEDFAGGVMPEDTDIISRYYTDYFQDEGFPAEVGRIIRSFAPCIACAVHIITSRDEFEFQII
ncbi:MAG: hypothetical protein Q8930_14055 [Bacillota bacterium]|nr:hypothetical protein [Bacillota bacterium]